mmetsp:Transcript_4026/g.11266  ORF Transcript_4026/g.11266 Transcript_4026/m.11266 type:complete len:318 (-) Transcript_4026:135-1088(-)
MGQTVCCQGRTGLICARKVRFSEDALLKDHVPSSARTAGSAQECLNAGVVVVPQERKQRTCSDATVQCTLLSDNHERAEDVDGSTMSFDSWPFAQVDCIELPPDVARSALVAVDKECDAQTECCAVGQCSVTPLDDRSGAPSTAGAFSEPLESRQELDEVSQPECLASLDHCLLEDCAISVEDVNHCAKPQEFDLATPTIECNKGSTFCPIDLAQPLVVPLSVSGFSARSFATAEDVAEARPRSPSDDSDICPDGVVSACSEEFAPVRLCAHSVTSEWWYDGQRIPSAQTSQTEVFMIYGTESEQLDLNSHRSSLWD